MNVFLNEYSGFCFALNFELNHFYARFNEKMDFQNGSARARWHCALEGGQFRFWSLTVPFCVYLWHRSVIQDILSHI